MTIKQRQQIERQRKLTDFDVKKIKYLYNTGNYSMRDLGKRYNVSRQTILNIVNERLRYAKGDL